MGMPTIVITGGAGFIGSAVCRYLVSQGLANVVNLDILTYAGNLSSIDSIKDSEFYHFEKVDICDSTLVKNIFDHYRPDGVMHLGAETHVDRSISGSHNFIQTNIVGTSVLLDVALEYWNNLEGDKKHNFRFLSVSTDEVYGSLGKDGLFTEDTLYDPSSPYSASKASSDHLSIAWYKTYGLPVLISNCSNNYGSHQFPEKLIPLVILNAIQHKPIPIYGDGSNVRDWLYVDDHVKALWLILNEGRLGEKYNVGGGNERSNLELVKKVCSVLDELVEGAPVGGHTSLIEFVDDRMGHDFRYAIDDSKLNKELGWKAEVDFDSGIRKTVGWYLENENWWRGLI